MRSPRVLNVTLPVAAVIVATGALELLGGFLGFDKAHVGLVYLLVVVASAALGGTLAALTAALASFLTWNFFFLPPYYTLYIVDPHDWLLLIVFLVIAVIVGQMTGRVRAREEEALERSRENAALYESSLAVGRFSEPQAALPSLLEGIVRGTGTLGAAVYRRSGDGIDTLAAAAHAPPLNDGEARLVEFVTAEVKAVGLHQKLHSGAADWPVSVAHADARRHDVWLPLTYGEQSLGALRVFADEPLSEAAERLLVAFASHVAASLERARLLEEMRAAARNQETERLKSVLFSSLSHNLKTPLASQTATVSSLMAEDVVFDRAAIEESVTMIAEDLGRLRDHIENLLSLAQLEAGAWSPNPEWVEVSELASVALRLLPAADRERVRLAGAGGSVLVHVDVSQLSQVLRHLVENALIYSPPETAVDVRVASDDSRVRIMVEDHGPGISPEEARRVFRKFYRGEAARRSAVRGTGLGLAICKEIVSAHHGEIRVERNEGGGARLVVELPAEAPPVVQNED